MINSGKLAGRTLFITGGSRGIGKAIALKAARDGANVIIAAKTAEPHPKLPGTIYTAAKEIEDAGGKCFPCIVDVREEEQVQKAVDGAVQQFGGIDILVNNASAIHLTGTVDTPMKRYDLMNNINTRGTFLTSKLCVPHLKKSSNPHILNLSPPLVMDAKWFKNHVAYTMAKYGMSMCVLGMSEELKPYGIAVNALWPRTAILTAAMEMLGGKEISKNCRKPEIVADAAYAILLKDSKTFTGNFCIDEKLLKSEGVNDLDQYAVEPGAELVTDFFLSDEDIQGGRLIGDAQEKSEVKSSGGGGGGGGGSKETASVFELIRGIVSDSMVKTIGASYIFHVKEGNSEQQWHIDLKEGNGSAGQGDPPSGKADVTFKTDKETFLKIFDGTLKPTSAFMSGKLKMKGDMGKAMKLDKLMAKLKSKL